jgi:hypothetical protein
VPELSTDEASDQAADTPTIDSASDVPPIDPTAVSRAYRVHRARRRARVAHTRATRRAGIRFWFVLLLLLAASVVLAVTFWRQVQELFGL